MTLPQHRSSVSRVRGRVRSLLAGLLVLSGGLLGSQAALAIDASRSGLPWPSGQSCFDRGDSPMAQVEAWRGHPYDVIVGWAPRTTFAAMVDWFERGNYRKIARLPPTPVVSVPLLTQEVPGQFAACAAGAFDDHFRRIAKAARANNRPDTVFRLGWEANGSWYPWSIGNDPEGYKACFRHVVDTIRSELPGATISWPMAKQGHLAYDVTKAYPGDAYVDIVGLSFYDRYPIAPDQKAWDDQYQRTRYGGPFGLKSWLAFATAHGKKLSFDEWGISDNGQGFDNAFFIKAMTDFFARNAKSIAFEAYYNCGEGAYQVYPESDNPNAGAAYREAYLAR